MCHKGICVHPNLPVHPTIPFPRCVCMSVLYVCISLLALQIDLDHFSRFHIYALICCCLVTKLSLTLFSTLWTVALQVPLSTGFPRQEHWSGLPFPPPGVLPSCPRDQTHVSSIGRRILLPLSHHTIFEKHTNSYTCMINLQSLILFTKSCFLTFNKFSLVCLTLGRCAEKCTEGFASLSLLRLALDSTMRM